MALPREDYVRDEAQILSSQELESLQELLEELSHAHGISIIAVTASSINGNMDAFAREEFFRGNDTRDGIILALLFDGANRQYYFYASDACYDIMEPKGFDRLEEVCLPLLKSGDYAGAIEIYARTAEELYLNPPATGTNGVVTLPRVLLCILIGALLSFLIPMNVLKGQLRTVRNQPGASEYIRKNSLVMSKSTDRFLYRNVSRVVKPQNNSSGSRGGGGGSRGGGRGGSF